MTTKKETRKNVTYKLLPSVIELIKELSKKQNRSMGNYLETLVLNDKDK